MANKEQTEEELQRELDALDDQKTANDFELLKLEAGDAELFSPEELKKIEKDARDEVTKDQKAKRRKSLVEAAKRRALAHVDPSEQIHIYTINLPPFANALVIDGVHYFSNYQYSFSAKQLASVRENESCAWKHEEVTMGRRNPNAYQAPRNAVIGGGGANVNTRAAFRV